jgi:hypothetical protein
MGTHHSDGGYSASVEAFVVIEERQLRLAKTNGVTFSLAEPCDFSIPGEIQADLIVTVDGATDSRRITLRDGLIVGQTQVKYDDVPF